MSFDPPPGLPPVIERHFTPPVMFDIAAAMFAMAWPLAAAAAREGPAGVAREALRVAAFAAQDPDLLERVDTLDEAGLWRLAAALLHNPLTNPKENPR